MSHSHAPRAIIFHGLSASPKSHWFPWIASHFPAGTVSIPEFPDPATPDVSAWVQTAVAELERADERTVVIAHSLGAITALRALAQLGPELRVARVILVSGFAESIPLLPELDEFTRDPLSFEHVTANSNAWDVFVSLNDAIVPPAATATVAARLNAELHEVPDAGHFLGSDGYETFPALVPLLGLDERDRY